jgi:hypothetical protein
VNTNGSVGSGGQAGFSQAPIVLQAYIIFALVASALAVAVGFSPRISAAVLRYTGWPGLSVYLFTIYFAMTALLGRRRQKLFSIVLLLGMAMVFGFLDNSRPIGGPGAPPVAASPFRPLFTITLPAIWILILWRTPGMRRWARGE